MKIMICDICEEKIERKTIDNDIFISGERYFFIKQKGEGNKIRKHKIDLCIKCADKLNQLLVMLGKFPEDKK